MSSVAEFFKKRIPVDVESLSELTNEPVPNHLKLWWFCLGGTPAYLFIIQIVTGILLTFYYIPNPDQAYESVRHITEAVPLGWYFRSLHKWSATLMIVAVILHVLRVFFTGAYRKPRELNWIIGTFILFTVLIFGFTGYSLVYEQLSYWGATVAGNITNAVPVIGPILANILQGGAAITDNTLTRYFILHIGVLPTVLIALLVLHIIMIRLHGVTEFAVNREGYETSKTFPFFPNHFLTEVLIGVVLMIVLTSLALIFPAELADKANPLVTPEHIKPEWYFYFTFRWLKITGLTVAILSLSFGGFMFMIWPFIDGFIRKKKPGSEFSMFIGAAVFILIIVLTLWEAIATH